MILNSVSQPHRIPVCMLSVYAVYEVSVEYALGKTRSTRIPEYCGRRLARCEQEEEESSQHSRHGQHKFPSPYEPPTRATSIVNGRAGNERPGDAKNRYDRVVAVCLAHTRRTGCRTLCRKIKWEVGIEEWVCDAN